jgi:glycosyltransferase involved in cell wall biosynthesis
MRIVVAHTRYLSGESSGENQVVDDEIRLLRDAGHDVVAWQPSAQPGPLGAAVAALDAVWSRRAVRHLRAVADDLGADVVHVHNLFPSLSPAVLRGMGDVPVVVTLHNYRFVCLPATFLRDGRTCEDCLGRAPWPGVVHRCYRRSFAGSAALATSLVVHRGVGSFARPARWLAVSDFVRRKYVEAGWDDRRLTVKHNFAWPTTRRDGPGEGFLYAGRLSPEKGVAELVRAWRSVSAPLTVVGDGPERDRLEAAAPANVVFTGAQSREEVAAAVRRSRAVVVPSTCYEGQPRIVLEAMAAGVPVVATRIGGLPELVTDGVDGRLVDVGADAGWRDAADLLGDAATSQRMGEAAHRKWERSFSPEVALKAAEAAYRAVAA